jgi:hypothetical protein
MGYSTTPGWQSLWTDNQLRSGGQGPGQAYQSPGWYGFGYDPLTGVGSANTKVEARYGAGAQAQPSGAAGQYATGDLNSQLGQMAQQGQQQAQQQSAAAQAAQLRGMNTPGGVDQWANRMQGAQRAQAGAMLGASPWGQAFSNQANTAAASALRNTNTPGGVSQYMRPQPMQQGMRPQAPPNWLQMMGQGPRRF